MCLNFFQFENTRYLNTLLFIWQCSWSWKILIALCEWKNCSVEATITSMDKKQVLVRIHLYWNNRTNSLYEKIWIWYFQNHNSWLDYLSQYCASKDRKSNQICVFSDKCEYIGDVYDSIAYYRAYRIQYREATERICSFNSFRQEKLSNSRRKGLSSSSVSYSTSSVICSVRGNFLKYPQGGVKF